MSSPENSFFVFASPPAGVSNEEFDEFYEKLLDSAMLTKEFVSSRRYWIEPASPEGPNVEFNHLVVFGIEGPPAAATEALEAGGRPEHFDETPWFDDIRWLHFDGIGLGNGDLEYPDEIYAVLSQAPKHLTSDDYNDWHSTHAQQTLTTDGFEKVWRYALTPGYGDVVAATHVALYECQGEPSDLQAALKASADAGHIDIPAWMPETEFFSCHGRAAAPAR